jgi:hypothetical protein
MAAGDVSIFKSGFYNTSIESNLYDTLSGKFLFDNTSIVQTMQVAGLNFGGWDSPFQSSNEVYFTDNLGNTYATNSYSFWPTNAIYGFTNNFALGTLEVAPNSTLWLTDAFPTDGKVAGLYANNLILDPGAILYIGSNVEFYYKGTNGSTAVNIGLGSWSSGNNVVIMPGGSFHYLNVVPEPSIFMLLVIGALGIYWRRRHRRQ